MLCGMQTLGTKIADRSVRTASDANSPMPHPPAVITHKRERDLRATLQRLHHQ
jgi:hypothetical protein